MTSDEKLRVIQNFLDFQAYSYYDVGIVAKISQVLKKVFIMVTFKLAASTFFFRIELEERHINM